MEPECSEAEMTSWQAQCFLWRIRLTSNYVGPENCAPLNLVRERESLLGDDVDAECSKTRDNVLGVPGERHAADAMLGARIALRSQGSHQCVVSGFLHLSTFAERQCSDH